MVHSVLLQKSKVVWRSAVPCFGEESVAKTSQLVGSDGMPDNADPDEKHREAGLHPSSC